MYADGLVDHILRYDLDILFFHKLADRQQEAYKQKVNALRLWAGFHTPYRSQESC
jgi:hypothetical protein